MGGVDTDRLCYREGGRDEPPCTRHVVGAADTRLFVPMPVAGQGNTAAREAWSPPQTPWGHPDLQGTWTNATTTPLERPADLAGKEVLTNEEWALRNPVSGLSDDRPIPGVGFYNDYWLEQGALSKSTSLIVDPPDGRLPAAVAGGTDVLIQR